MGTKSLLVLLLSSLLSADVKPDLDLLAQSHFVDVVSVQNAPEYMVYLKALPKQEDYLATPLSHVVFKPQWKYYSYKQSGQLIAVAELAPEHQWFNAAIYNTLTLQGRCDSCQVALADKVLFSKQDNFIIGDFQKEFSLNPLRKRVDLRHLKYLVVLIKEKKDLKLSSITFRSHFSRKNRSQKSYSVWVWKSQDLNYELLHKKKIKRVYLQMDKGFEKSATKLHNEGFEVYGLDGDPHDIFSPLRLQNSLKRIIQLNTSKQVVAGFQIDVEPHVLKDFDIDKTKHIKAFVTLVSLLSKSAHQHKLAFSLVTPFWYDALYFKKRPLIYTLIDLSDETVLMSYRSDPNSVLRISADELSYASYRHKKVQIGVELMPIADERHKLYKITKKLPCITKKRFEEDCVMLIPETQYTIKGSALSFDGQSKRLKTLLESPILYPAFEGFVFHHMRGLH